MKTHAALNPAIEGVPFVEREVVPGAGAQQEDHFFQGILRLVFQNGRSPVDQRSALQIGDDLCRQFVRRSHNIGQPGLDRVERHAVELGRLRVLNQRDTRFLFDGAQPERAVSAHARKNDADTVLLPVLRQRAKKEINRQAQAAGCCRVDQVQHPVQDRHVFIRRDHIDTIRPHGGAVPDLNHLHAGHALQQLRHHPLVCRVQMLDDHESHAAVRRHMPQKLLQRLEPAGGGADADNRE